MPEAFEKVMMKNGESRSDYIQRRLEAGAQVKTIVAEINAPELHNSFNGKPWTAAAVYQVMKKIGMKVAPAPKPLNKPLFPDHLFKLPTPAAVKAAVEAKKAAEAAAEDPVNQADEAGPEPETAEVPPEYAGVLDATDIAEIQEEAKKKVLEASRKRARADLLAQATAELEREATLARQRGALSGDLVDVTLDLAPYAPCIKIDGQPFYHGTTVRVPRKQAAVLREQMQRSWAHMESISGQKNDWNRQRAISISPHGVKGVEGLRA